MLRSSSTPLIATPSLEEENCALQARVAHLEQQLRHQQFVEQKLQSKIEDLLRRMFGPKSEKLNPNQRELLFAQIETDQSLKAEVPPQPLPCKADVSSKKRGGGRRPAPEHLPIERVEIDLKSRRQGWCAFVSRSPKSSTTGRASSSAGITCVSCTRIRRASMLR